MTIHRFDPTDRPAVTSASRRAIVQRLGSASLLAATITMAPARGVGSGGHADQ